MRYALIEGGQAREIFPGQPFTTQLLVEAPAPEPAEGEEPGEPTQQLQEFTFIGQWLEAHSAEALEGYGVKTVMLATAPEAGQRVVSTELAVDGDDVVEVATYEPIPEPPLATAQAGALAALDAERETRIATDFQFDFGATVAVDDQGEEEPAGVRALQMGVNNRRDWQALQGLALTVGGGDAVMPIRCSDNVNVQTTATQVLQVLAAATVRGSAIVFYAAARKALVRQATTAAEVAQIVTDSTAWPA